MPFGTIVHMGSSQSERQIPELPQQNWVDVRISTFILVLCMAAMSVAGQPGISPDYQALAPLLRDASLDKMTKISRISEFFKHDPYCYQALMWVAQVDEKVAGRRLKREFQNDKRGQQEKLKIGRALLTDTRFDIDNRFIDDYAPWLIRQVIAQRASITQILPEGRLTPIGEYANIANSFQGHSDENLDKIRTDRVVATLIAALEMRDNVYSKHQEGCIVRGKPGASTGRNLDRQNVPVALARLAAAEAVPALRRVLESHHDWNFRDNAAFALGMLLKRDDRGELAAWMKEHKSGDDKLDRFRHLFAFGKGLLKSGDDAGVQFMAFEYSTYFNQLKLSEVTYMFEERLDVVKDLRSRELAQFYKQAFEYGPLMNVFLFDKDNVQINDYGHTKYDLPKAERRVRKLFDQAVSSIEKNKFEQVVPLLHTISSNSRNKAIRTRAGECLKNLNQNR